MPWPHLLGQKDRLKPIFPQSGVSSGPTSWSIDRKPNPEKKDRAWPPKSSGRDPSSCPEGVVVPKGTRSEQITSLDFGDTSIRSTRPSPLAPSLLAFGAKTTGSYSAQPEETIRVSPAGVAVTLWVKGPSRATSILKSETQLVVLDSDEEAEGCHYPSSGEETDQVMSVKHEAEDCGPEEDCSPWEVRPR